MGEQKHFKVVWGKTLGVPLGSFTPVTPKGNLIFVKYFAPFALGILTALYSKSGIVFVIGWCFSAFMALLFIRQLKSTAIFERQYFFKHNSE